MKSGKRRGLATARAARPVHAAALRSRHRRPVTTCWQAASDMHARIWHARPLTYKPENMGQKREREEPRERYSKLPSEEESYWKELGETLAGIDDPGERRLLAENSLEGAGVPAATDAASSRIIEALLPAASTPALAAFTRACVDGENLGLMCTRCGRRQAAASAAGGGTAEPRTRAGYALQAFALRPEGRCMLTGVGTLAAAPAACAAPLPALAPLPAAPAHLPLFSPCLLPSGPFGSHVLEKCLTGLAGRAASAGDEDFTAIEEVGCAAQACRQAARMRAHELGTLRTRFAICTCTHRTAAMWSECGRGVSLV